MPFSFIESRDSTHNARILDASGVTIAECWSDDFEGAIAECHMWGVKCASMVTDALNGSPPTDGSTLYHTYEVEDGLWYVEDTSEVSVAMTQSMGWAHKIVNALNTNVNTCRWTAEEDGKTYECRITRKKANELIRWMRKTGTVMRHEGMRNCYDLTTVFGTQTVLDTRWLA